MFVKTQAIEPGLTKSLVINQRLNQTYNTWSLKSFEDIFPIIGESENTSLMLRQEKPRRLLSLLPFFLQALFFNF